MEHAEKTGAFWDAFARTHWERTPTTFPWPTPALPADRDDVWALLQCAAAGWRAGDPVNFRFWQNGHRREHDLGAVLPHPDDTDLHGFTQRLGRQAHGGEFSLMLNGAHLYHHGIWLAARRFVDGLVARVGLPGLQADVDLIVGDYTHTGFGIHKDTAGNFSLMIEGRKTILAWPDTFFDDKSVRMNHLRNLIDDPVAKTYRKEAVVLSGGPGDTLYWPKSYWHVSDSERGLSITLSIALYLEEPYPGMWLDGLMSGMVVHRLSNLPTGPATWPVDDPCDEAALARHPEWAVLPQLAAFDWHSLQTDLLALRLSKQSAGGFVNYPRYRPETLGPRPEPFRVDTAFPVLTHAVDAQMLVACQGHHARVPFPEQVTELVALLRRGGPFLVADLRAHLAAETPEQHALIETVLNVLHQARVIQAAEVSECTGL